MTDHSLNAADRRFAKAMIPHHRMAIDMAEAVLKDGKSPQIKGIARAIVKAQAAEIVVLETILAEAGDGGGADKPKQGGMTMDHRFADAAPLGGIRRTRDGFLVAEAFVAREGIQVYSGREVGRPERDAVRVWRPRDEVMAPESVRTYSHAPVTLGHPDAGVTADTWAALAKGEVSTEAEWRDGKLRLPLIVKDAAAIAAIEGGTRELSAGYVCALDWTAGTTPDGEAYDAVQRGIRINHVAIVPRGRAGAECRIGDTASAWGASPITLSDRQEDRMSDPLKTVVLGDKAARVAAEDVPLFDAYKAAMDKRLADAEAEHAKVEAERDALKAKVLSDTDLDRRVADRAALVAKARAIAPDLKPEGLSDAAIRKAAVVAKLGDAAIKDRSEAYIDARFDILAEDAAKTDPVADVIKDGTLRVGDAKAEAEKARAAHIKQIADAWKAPAAQH